MDLIQIKLKKLSFILNYMLYSGNILIRLMIGELPKSKVVGKIKFGK